MRKVLAIWSVLLVLGTAAVGWCIQTVYAPHDQVQYTQTVLAGDPAAADGLTVQTNSEYKSRLFWHTTARMQQGTPHTQTDYRFYQTKQTQSRDVFYRGVDIISEFNSYDENFMNIPEEQRTALDLAYQELYERAVPGQEASKTITLSDYYEYYPIAGYIDLEGTHVDFNIWSENNAEGNVVSEKMNAFFRIPVLPEERLTISLEKDENGNICSTGSGTDEEDHFRLQSESIVTPQTCYFTFYNRSDKGKIMDTSLIPGGYGIYALDYTPGKVEYLNDGGIQYIENGRLQLDSLRMAFPIDPNEELMRLSQWQDGSFLLLYTRTEDAYYLTVIATDTMQQVQRLKIHPSMSAEAINYNIMEKERFIAILLDHTMIVLLPNGDGTFRIDMQTPNTLDDAYIYVSWNISENAIDYHNGKLAYAFESYDQETGYQEHLNYELVVINQQGLQFWSKYQSSMQNDHIADLDHYNASEMILLNYTNPIQVSWK